MTSMLRLEVRKDDLTETRLQPQDHPQLKAGEVLCRVDRFALTANNVTYGVVGERIGYWKFFPADEGWGVIPVWGFADVVESQHPDIPVGERLYGYWPMGTHVVLKPEAIKPDRLVDGSAHRAELPPVYNSYSRTAGEPHFEADMEDERMLLMPLYATSYCLYDFLRDNDYFGASRVLIISASSKTALGLAMALAEDEAAPTCTALTSTRNFAWVNGLGLYQDVLAYDDVDQLDASIPTVIVDMSGNGALLARLHRHLGDNMRYCSNVGITHYDAAGMEPGFIAERSAMFFAPSHIQKRGKDWGPGVFQQKVFAFWQRAARKSRGWLQLDAYEGMDGVESAYRQVHAGGVEPSRGMIVRL